MEPSACCFGMTSKSSLAPTNVGTDDAAITCIQVLLLNKPSIVTKMYKCHSFYCFYKNSCPQYDQRAKIFSFSKISDFDSNMSSQQ